MLPSPKQNCSSPQTCITKKLHTILSSANSHFVKMPFFLCKYLHYLDFCLLAHKRYKTSLTPELDSY